MIHVLFTVDFVVDPWLAIECLTIYMTLGAELSLFLLHRLNKQLSRPVPIRVHPVLLCMALWPIVLPMFFWEERQSRKSLEKFRKDMAKDEDSWR